MPLLLFIIVVVLVAQIGFWDTLQAILGAVAMVVLVVILAIVALAVLAYLFVRRGMRRF